MLTSRKSVRLNALGLGLAVLTSFVTVTATAQSVDITSRRARPDSSFAAPAYPDMLRSAGFIGSVTARFVVDSSGRVDMRSFVVGSSVHGHFTASVKNGLRGSRFAPAISSGRHVADTLEMTFRFELPEEKVLQLEASVLRSLSNPAPGVWRAVIGGPVKQPDESYDAATLRAATLSALDTLLDIIASRDSMLPSRIACIGLSTDKATAQPDIQTLARLSRPRVAVVVHARCPPGFGGPTCMVRVEESGCRPYPPGEDPRRITVQEVRIWGDRVLVDIDVSFATVAESYSCFTVKDSTYKFGWRSMCRLSATGVSIARQHPHATAGIGFDGYEGFAFVTSQWCSSGAARHVGRLATSL